MTDTDNKKVTFVFIPFYLNSVMQTGIIMAKRRLSADGRCRIRASQQTGYFVL